MSHAKEIAFALSFMSLGCVSARPTAPESDRILLRRWRPIERDGLLVFEPDVPSLTRFRVRIVGPEHPSVGQIVTAEIWVPGAKPGERHRFCVHPTQPGVRLLDPDTLETIGTQPSRMRFTSDRDGTGGIGFSAE